MASIDNILQKINSNIILRNVILAVCAIIVFLFLVSILLNAITRHNRSETVPDLSGMSMEQARKAAGKGDLRLEINDSIYVPSIDGGIILDQLPKPNTKVKSGRRVFLTVNSYGQKMVRIPYVTGYSLRQAKNNLEVKGLEIDRIVYRPDIATNNVLEEQYNGKVITRGSTLEAEQGSGITLIVGMRSDDALPLVPKLVGFPLNEAKSRIWEAGLNIGDIKYEENVTLLDRKEAKVWSQSPEQGTRVNHGATVTIMLSLDGEKVSKGSSASDKAATNIINRQQAEEQTEQADTEE